jgi:hypothetical protein
MRPTLLAISAGALVLAACGGSTSGVSTADVQRFDTVSLQVGTTVTTYGTQAASMQDVVACDSLQATYDGEVRPMVGVLMSMGGRMDHQMDGMGHMSDGDMGCSADAMQAELDRHRGAACTSADVTVDRAEAARHVAAMGQWAAHEAARAQETGSMMGMMGMGGTGGSVAGHCVHGADGTFTFQP